MIARAFRDMWSPVMFLKFCGSCNFENFKNEKTSDVFKVLKIARAAGECNLRTLKTSCTHADISRNALAFTLFPILIL